MNQVIVCTPEELRQLISEELAKLVNHSPADQKQAKEIIDRKELMRRLNVTLPTILRMEEKGKIKAIRLGTSVRYDWGSVISSLEKSKKKGGSS